MDKQPAVYMVTSDRMGTLYIGVTSNLLARTWQHRNHALEGFSRKYAVASLVWYEFHADLLSVIKREKQLRKWNRAWKIRLIEERNVTWRDLWEEIAG